jgi:hypothetical protein
MENKPYVPKEPEWFSLYGSGLDYRLDNRGSISERGGENFS